MTFLHGPNLQATILDLAGTIVVVCVSIEVTVTHFVRATLAVRRAVQALRRLFSDRP